MKTETELIKENYLKEIYIVLTRTRTIVSRAVYLMTRETYTHSSMALDASLTTLYSSSRKNGITMFPAGPCRETLTNRAFRKDPDIPCAVYKLEVDDATYERVKRELARIMAVSGLYHYNILGLLLCYFHIVYRRKYYLFCSQFIGDILLRSGAMRFNKDTALIKPNDYAKMNLHKCYEGTLGGLHLYLAAMKKLASKRKRLS